MLPLLKDKFTGLESRLFARMISFALLSCIVYSCQLVGMTSLIDGITGNNDDLKSRVSYWATVCATAYSLLIYTLGRWFTKDLYWHWNVGTSIWAITPSFGSIMLVRDVKNWIGRTLSVTMLFVFVVSTGLNTWITHSAKFSPYDALGSPTSYNLSNVYGLGGSDNRSMFHIDNWHEYTGFVQQTSMGYVDERELNYYDGAYYWVPLLMSKNFLVVDVKNVTAIGMVPSCKLVPGDKFQVVENGNTAAIGGYNATITDDTGETVFSLQTHEYANNYWAFFERGYNQHSHVYTAFSRSRLHGTPSYLGKIGSTTSYLYVMNCTVSIHIRNVTGTLNSYEKIRSNITGAVDVVDDTTSYERSSKHLYMIYDAVQNYVEKSNEGTFIDDNKTMFWNWWARIPDNITMTDWMEDRMLKIIAYTMTETGSARDSYTTTGIPHINTTIIMIRKWVIIWGVIMQIGLSVAILGIYIFHNNPDVYHSDDVDYLLMTSREEQGEGQGMLDGIQMDEV